MYDEVIRNQLTVLHLQKWIIVLLSINFLFLFAILVWKLLVYPQLFELSNLNRDLLAVTREVMHSMRRKQDETLVKQDVTIGKVDKVDEKLDTAARNLLK